MNSMMSTRSEHSQACNLSADDTLGPSVTGCRDNFDFTLLFEQAILSIGPSALLLLCIPFRIIQLSKQSRKTRSNALRYAKLIVITLLLALQVALVVLWTSKLAPPVRTGIPANCVALAVAFCLLGLSVLEHDRSFRSSDLINVYLLLSIVLDAAQTRTIWLLTGYSTVAAVTTGILCLKTIWLALEAQGKSHILEDQYRALPSETLSGVFSRLFFWWLNTLFRQGSQSIIPLEELEKVDTNIGSQYSSKRLQAAWDRGNGSSHVSLVKTCAVAFWTTLLIPAIPRLLLVAFKYAQPFLINAVVSLFKRSDDENTKNDGYGLMAATGIIYIGITVSTTYHQHKMYRFVTMLRGALVAIIYSKTMLLDIGQASESASVTLMSTDIEGIAGALPMLHDIWASPLEIAIAIWLLEKQIGVACVISAITAVVCTLITFYISKQMGSRQATWNKAVQERVAMTSSALDSMKSIKLMGLRDQISADIQRQRVRELDLSKKFRMFVVIINVIASFPSLVSPVITFGVFIAIRRSHGHGSLELSQAFTSLSLIFLLCNSVSAFVGSLPTLAASLGCFERIEKLIVTAESTDHRLANAGLGSLKGCISSPHGEDSSLSVEIPLSDISKREPLSQIEDLCFRLAHASFGFVDSKPVLRDIDVKVQESNFTIIIGSSGCGKSVFLKALLGEVPCLCGSLFSKSSQVAYCDQSPWLWNATVRSNIVGQSRYERRWYETVLEACALEEDLRHLSHGDKSIVGSGGINLSGGQKQRIALARAIYSQERIIILDDIFSGLDSKTAHHVFTRLLGDQGMLRQNKNTIILATHAVQYLHFADNIIVLGEDGRISQQGSFEHLNLQRIPRASYSSHGETGGVFSESMLPGEDALPRPVSPFRQDIEDLSRKTGDFAVYRYWFQSVGWLACAVFLGLSAVYVFMSNFSQVWLRLWAEADNSGQHDRVGFYLGIYALLGVLGIFSIGVVIWYMFIIIVPTSAQNLHWTLLKTVMGAHLSFFNTTDNGVTLNRFSQDMQLVDMNLPAATFRSVVAAFNCIAAAVLLSIGATYFAISIPFLAVCLYILQKYYLRTSRQLRLLDLEAKSPLYTHFSETRDGLVTIRAFGWQSAFEEQCSELLDSSQKPYYFLFCIQRWLNLVMGLFTAAVAVLLVSLGLSFRGSSSSGALGVGLVTVLGLSEQVTLLIIAWTALETSLGAIARLKTFEKDVLLEETTPVDMQSNVPENWPSQGGIVVQDVTVSYSPDSRPALQGFSLSIKPGSKIGICGRTGSGKSTLLLTLARLLSPTTGTIHVDNINISSIPLQVLRSRLSIIPQDPFILSGSVRLNLEGGGQQRRTDAEFQSALTKVGLWGRVFLPKKANLDTDIAILSLSHGQKQLLAFARALLHEGQIVLMDEATSHIDDETDMAIQRLIREEFINRTVVSVVHRVANVRDYDSVVIMERGKIIEHGVPAELLLAANSAFRQLSGGGST